jgi:hypothetical protein
VSLSEVLNCTSLETEFVSVHKQTELMNMYVIMYVCMYVCVCMYECMNVCMYVCTYVYVCWQHRHRFLNMGIFLSNVYLHTYIYIYIYSPIHIHTYIHT